jgi:hypothetical protein
MDLGIDQHRSEDKFSMYCQKKGAQQAFWNRQMWSFREPEGAVDVIGKRIIEKNICDAASVVRFSGDPRDGEGCTVGKARS